MKAAIFTVAAGALGGTATWIYNIGFNNGARDLATLEAFKSKLPNLIDDINKVSNALSEKAELIDQNKRLAKAAADALSDKKKSEEQVKDQSKELDEKSKRIADLNALVEKAFPAGEIKVSIAQGAAERVIPNLLTIGVKLVYGSTVDTYVNGQSLSFYPGDPKKVTLGDRICTIEVLQVASPSSFVVTCSKN
jgi:hypothetical protein